MQIDSRLTYAIIGSLITLLLVFLFKVVFLSSSLVPDTIVSTDTHCEDVTTVAQQQSTQVKSQVKQVEKIALEDSPFKEDSKSEKQFVEQCDERCLANTVSSLISGEGLGNEDGISITSDRANQIAELLKDDPSKLAEIQTSLSSFGDQNARDTILYVFSRLPDDQIQQLARNLSSSQNTRDRIDSLSLLESVSNTSFDAQSEIKQIISTENDPDILLKAIKISHNLDPNVVDSTTQSRLSNLITSSGNDNIRSAALITKTRIVQNDPALQNDISTALNSSSKRFKEAGLQALDGLLNKKNNNNNAWKNSSALRQNVESIANDPNADPYTRVEALNLIQRHYR